MEEGEGVSSGIQRADVKKVLGSVHMMNMGGTLVFLDGDESYTPNNETKKKTRISYG